MSAQLELALFEAPSKNTHAHSCCDGACLTHILMPNMAWACGGSILDKGGHIEFLSGWVNVTCADCLGEGVKSIQARTRRQQWRCGVCVGALDKAGDCKACGA